MRHIGALLFALLVAAPVGAAELRIGVEAGASSLDPHFFINQQNDMMAAHVFDALTRQDERQRLAPGLALSWTALDDETWEFKLRPGVHWHDGRPFTAEDVIATVRRAPNVPNSPASYGEYVRQIVEATAPDPLTVRFRTRGPFPLHPVYLSNIAIVPKSVAETATTSDFNSGKAMIGTGAFRFVEWAPGDHATYARSDGYWGAAEPWDRVLFRAIPNGASRVAALLAGDLDMIDAVPPSQIARLRQAAGVSLAQTASNRVILLNLDLDRDASPFIVDATTNPLKDSAVRAALSKAVNRPALAERVMDGSAVPVGQLVPEALFGYNPDLPPPAYDPDGAKRDLAAAGYPNGFGLTLHCPNDRYVNDALVCQSIAQMLTRIGVRTAVDAMPKAVYFTRASKREFSLFLTGWGSGTGEASLPLKTVLHSPDKEKGYGAANRGGYASAAFDWTLEQALATIDDAARAWLLRKASAIAMADVAVIPLYAEVNTWATRRGIAYTPRTDGYTIASFARPEVSPAR